MEVRQTQNTRLNIDTCELKADAENMDDYESIPVNKYIVDTSKNC